MSILFDLPYTDRLGNDIYTDFKNMIMLEQLMGSETFSESQKLFGGLRLLYGDEIPEDLETAIGELNWFYQMGEENTANKKQKKVFDFTQDAPFLMASFMAAYNIDLSDCKMHWWKFLSLFLALPEDTRMMSRMQDRCIDTSKMKGEQKKYYEERKKAAALKNTKLGKAKTYEESVSEKQKMLDRLYAEAEANKK